MTGTLSGLLSRTLDRLTAQVASLLPPLLAGAIILLAAYILAVASRWILIRLFKGAAIDRFLRRSGLAFMLDPSGRLRAAHIAAEGAYWGFLTAGGLGALSIVDTRVTERMLEGFVFLLPRLILRRWCCWPACGCHTR